MTDRFDKEIEKEVAEYRLGDPYPTDIPVG